MSGPLKHFDTAVTQATGAIRLAAQGSPRGVNANRKAPAPARFPQRPDLAVLHAAIPFFYIGQNKHGFWVAREAERRSGGLFLSRRSALRFAKKRSEPAGCAIMFLSEPVELDIENQGSRLAAPLAAVIEGVIRRAPRIAAFIGMAVTEWHKLLAEISRALSGERRNRAAIERELFHGEYTLSSKNDDDLPVP